MNKTFTCFLWYIAMIKLMSVITLKHLHDYEKTIIINLEHRLIVEL